MRALDTGGGRMLVGWKFRPVTPERDRSSSERRKREEGRTQQTQSAPQWRWVDAADDDITIVYSWPLDIFTAK